MPLCQCPDDYDYLTELRAQIGETQLRIARRDADHAETASIEREFGPHIRTNLDDYQP